MNAASRCPPKKSRARTFSHMNFTGSGITQLHQGKCLGYLLTEPKNLRLGQGLETTRSRTAKRLEELLLIAHLGAFVQRLIGEDAKTRQLELQFTSTCRKTRPEISVLTLARRLLAAPTEWLDQLTPWAAIPPLRAQAQHACAPQ